MFLKEWLRVGHRDTGAAFHDASQGRQMWLGKRQDKEGHELLSIWGLNPLA